MQEDYSLLVASVYELVEKIRAQQFITAVTQTDSEISFTYRNGFKQRFSLLRQNNDKIDLDSLKSDIYRGISEKLNNDFALGLENIQKSMLLESETYRHKYVSVFNDFKDELVLKTEGSYNDLFNKLDSKLSDLVSALPIPKDGIDADANLIITTITKALEGKIEEYKKILDKNILSEVQKNISNIPIPQNGVDGKDADEEKIISKLLEELRQILELDFSGFKNSLKSELALLISKQKEEVSAVIAPSALGNKADINPIINKMPTNDGNALLKAMVGKSSSGFTCKLFCCAYKNNKAPSIKNKKFTNTKITLKLSMFFCASLSVFTLIFFCIIS